MWKTCIKLIAYVFNLTKFSNNDDILAFICLTQIFFTFTSSKCYEEKKIHFSSYDWIAFINVKIYYN